MKFTVLIPEKVSLNRIYAGTHFRERSAHKDAYRLAVMCVKCLRPYEGPFPVKVHYHFRLAGSKLDISNHAYMVKMLEDGLVANGVLPDDDPKYVAQITVTGEKAEKWDGDEVEVDIVPHAIILPNA